MTAIVDHSTTTVFPHRCLNTTGDSKLDFAHKRLTEVFERAEKIYFDDSARFVFFSDSHRGDNGRADAFLANEALFIQALQYYHQNGFTYVEVGDGDELYKYRLCDVQRAHGRAFDLLHQFDQKNRLHLVFGNHDIETENEIANRQARIERDGIPAYEGIILCHAQTGQHIFVVHGHQVDFMSDRFRVFSRWVVRYVWKPLQTLFLGSTLGQKDRSQGFKMAEKVLLRYREVQRARIEGRISNWLAACQQPIICGHTHAPKFAQPGTIPYFNTGSCVYPGHITGIEIQDGQIAPVRWMGQSRTGIERELMSPPKALTLYN